MNDRRKLAVDAYRIGKKPFKWLASIRDKGYNDGTVVTWHEIGMSDSEDDRLP